VFEAPIEQLRARQQVRVPTRGRRPPGQPRGALLRMHDEQPCNPPWHMLSRRGARGCWKPAT